MTGFVVCLGAFRAGRFECRFYIDLAWPLMSTLVCCVCLMVCAAFSRRRKSTSIGSHFHDRFFLGGSTGAGSLLGFEDRRVGGEIGERDQVIPATRYDIGYFSWCSQVCVSLIASTLCVVCRMHVFLQAQIRQEAAARSTSPSLWGTVCAFACFGAVVASIACTILRCLFVWGRRSFGFMFALQRRRRVDSFYDAIGGDIVFAASLQLRTALPGALLQDLGVRRWSLSIVVFHCFIALLVFGVDLQEPVTQMFVHH